MVEGRSEVMAIGGYFELADRECKSNYPIRGIRLNTCRNALEYIISHLPDIKHVFLPIYTCDAVIEPLNRLKISYDFYRINNRFEISGDINLMPGDYIIVNNYFGLKDAYISELAEKIGNRMIVDNAQAMYAPILPGIKAVYSARKYFGVADGGFAVGVPAEDNQSYEVDTTVHDSHLLIRKQYGAEAGFRNYQQDEILLCNQPIRRMSCATEEILTHIDYDRIKKIRTANFEYLHAALSSTNILCDYLTHCLSEGFACPMIYPYIGSHSDKLRTRLIENKVFVARYWPNVFQWTKPGDLEYKLASNLIPLPIDQRYGVSEMNDIINLVQ